MLKQQFGGQAKLKDDDEGTETGKHTFRFLFIYENVRQSQQSQQLTANWPNNIEN